MMKINKFYAFLIIVLLVGTTVHSSFAIAQIAGGARVFTPPPKPDTGVSAEAKSAAGISDYRTSSSSFGSGGSFLGSSSSAGYYSSQYRPNYETYYGSNVNTYWPILGDREMCEGRQDLLLGVAPFGCQPAVVRSDLLAEQNVPVFCQIDAAKINPLIDINQIRNVRFNGEYPVEVAGVGFHPAKAALRTRDTLLGSPLVNNIGYVVVVLKRQPDESKLPDNINLTLGAQLEYIAGNAYGIGKTEFSLSPVADSDWDTEKLKNSFWNGRYFVRLEHVEQNFADVTIYSGDRKIRTTRVERGKESAGIYVPGMYCRAGLKISYDGYVSAEKKARIEISSSEGTDVFDVNEGTRFNEVCSISTIDINEDGKTGFVRGSCYGKRFELSLNNSKLSNGTVGSLPNAQASVLYLDRTYNPRDDPLNNIHLNSKSGEILGLYINKTDVVDSNLDVVGRISSVGSGKYKIAISMGMTTEENYHLLNEAVISADKIAPKVMPLESITGSENAPQSLQYYNQALDYYTQTAEDYTNEVDVTGVEKYGEQALRNAIILAKNFGRAEDQRILLNKFIELYPDSELNSTYKNDLKNIESIDYSDAVTSIEFEDRTRTIRLVDLQKPNKEASAELIVDSRREKIKLKETRALMDGGFYAGNITLNSMDAEQARVNYYCVSRDRNGNNLLGERRSEVLRIDEDGKPICGLVVRLDRSNVEQIAKIRLLPFAEGTQSVTNFSVNIGIEKRAIKLNPDKALEKVERLNETIKKWEDISNKLGNVVSGLKTACFGVSAALTFKNLLTGLSGKALARQQIMNGEHGWTSVCQDMVAQNKYPTLDACFNANSDKIEKDVSTQTNAINKVNKRMKEIQDANKNNPEGAANVFGNSVNTDAARLALAADARQQYGSKTINLGDKKWINDKGEEVNEITVNEFLSDANAKDNLVSTEGVREAMLYAELKDNPELSPDQKKNIERRMQDTAVRVNDNRVFDKSLKNEALFTEKGLAKTTILTANEQQSRVMNVVGSGGVVGKENYGFGELAHTSTVTVSAASTKGPDGTTTSNFDAGEYVLGLRQIDAATGTYNVEKVWNEKTKKEVNTADFVSTYKIGTIKSAESVDYHNEIASADRVVKYYETEPYKGMPAVVPFDIKQGWYAATRQTLPAFGGIGAFDSSGRVTSFWLCNVGSNKRVEFESGLGDDICQQINLNTGQPLGYFPGLENNEARTLINKAVSAVEEAARKYGSKNKLTINGQEMKVGKPAVGVPGTKCQDFMSPKDCQLMFNVCDPVVCPSSRCDLGGKFPVANVAQTGIAGSALLCLPNIREGIVIPVCLTGIKAGIDGWISIMKSYRDCLKESVDTGNLVGICDEMYSIYLCDFFWGQVAPFANVLLPKLLEVAYGQGTRGGAEYLTVNAAWQNMENSVNYFTQSYAVNSLKSFQARSGEKFGGSSYLLEGGVSEIGAQYCKSFASAKAPNAFKTLIESDSPPQFNAWFDAKRFSDATVPATSQYKVFYHIFAGKDKGVSFSVYLRDAPDSSYYSIAPRVSVASGFIARGESASETKDFTAPEGYKELCVRIDNEEECGFKQVSSSFAVNYIRDSYAKDQLENANIQTEAECISGSRDARTLLNPNLQQGVEETAFPEEYNRGIVRICSTSNPGSNTDPTRFVDMGYCSDQKVRCWLDKQSVDKALTANNIGMKNETLEALNNRAMQGLIENKEILSEGDAAAQLKELGDEVNGLGKGSTLVVDYNKLIGKADALQTKLFFNYQKANLLFIKGRASDKAAMYFRTIENQNKQGSIVTSGGSSAGSTTGTGSGTIIPGNGFLTLRRNAAGKMKIYDRDQITKYYVEDNKVIAETEETEGVFGPPHVEVGEVNGGYVEIKEEYVEEHIEIEGKVIEGLYEESVVSGDSSKCSLRSETAVWYDRDGVITDTKEGHEVIMKVDGYNCKGVEIKFDIYEDDLEEDELVESITGIVYSETKNVSYLSVPWTAKWKYASDDDWGEDDERDYYFIAKVKETGKWEMTSDNLQVGKSDGSESVTPRMRWTLDSAVLEIKKKDGLSTYSDNKQFIDEIHQDLILSDDEYADINGDAYFDNEEDMRYVTVLLIKKKDLNDWKSNGRPDYYLSEEINSYGYTSILEKGKSGNYFVKDSQVYWEYIDGSDVHHYTEIGSFDSSGKVSIYKTYLETYTQPDHRAINGKTIYGFGEEETINSNILTFVDRIRINLASSGAYRIYYIGDDGKQEYTYLFISEDRKINYFNVDDNLGYGQVFGMIQDKPLSELKDDGGYVLIKILPAQMDKEFKGFKLKELNEKKIVKSGETFILKD